MDYRSWLNSEGKPVTAHDAVYTLTEILPKHHPRAASWSGSVESISAEDDHKFTIRLKQPSPSFLMLVGAVRAISGAYVMPKHIYQGTDIPNNPKNFAPIGSGPFKFKEWVRGSHVELVRNENYFKEGLPYLDRFIMRIIPDQAARMIAFEKGEIDYVGNLQLPLNLVPKFAEDPQFQIIRRTFDVFACTQLVLVNLRGNHESNEPLADEMVRKALLYATNRQEIVEKAVFGYSAVAHSPVDSRPPVAWAHTAEFDVYDYDPAKANRMLDEAGYPKDANGHRFELRIVKASGREHESRAWDVMRDQWREIGVTLRPQVLDRPAFIDVVFRNWDFDLAMQQFCSGPDPNAGVSTRYHTQYKDAKRPFSNGMGYSNPELDKLFDADAKLYTTAERAPLWHEIQRILMDDLPVFPLFPGVLIQAANAKVHGLDGADTPIASRERIWLSD